MIRPLVGKIFRDARLLLAALMVLTFAFPWAFIWTSSMVNLPAFSEFLAKAIPRQMERLSAVPFSELATPAGRIAIVFAHPLVMLSAMLWVIARGSDCVSGEISRGTMEMLLAQPVRRITVYATQALTTILGSALLTGAAWCGIAVGLATVTLSAPVSAALYIPPALNLFGLMVCVGGMSAFASSWDSQRWRTVGLMCAWYILSTILEIVGQVSDDWGWLRYLTFKSAYQPQAMVARPDEAWTLLAHADGAMAGLGGRQLILFGLGLLCYALGAIVFNRREIPAPL